MDKYVQGWNTETEVTDYSGIVHKKKPYSIP